MANKTRQEYNREIIEKLNEIVEKMPYLRFNQMLWVLNVISHNDKGDIEDNFYEESSVTLDKVKEAVIGLKK